MFLRFLKLYKRYQIAQSITISAKLLLLKVYNKGTRSTSINVFAVFSVFVFAKVAWEIFYCSLNDFIIVLHTLEVIRNPPDFFHVFLLGKVFLYTGCY